MIQKEKGYFVLSTDNSSYIFRVLGTGHLDNVYYGKRLDDLTGIERLSTSGNLFLATIPYYDEEHQNLFPEIIRSEYPTPLKGDARESALEIEGKRGIESLTLLYDSYRIFKGKDFSFPAFANADEKTETLEIKLKDELLPIEVLLRYTVYEEEDVILRSATIINSTDSAIKLRNAASLSLDLPYDDFNLLTYSGAWGRERQEERRKLLSGIVVNDSKLGVTSNEHSPLVFLERELTGEVYGFNLIYSGNHRETVEVSPFGKTRVITGINPWLFEWKMQSGESFNTPEAIMTYGEKIEDASLSFHHFTNKYIIRGEWQYRERPVLINSWEAVYFNLEEEKLLALAEKASELGFELFVLDDGWFGSRRNDRRGLGDWYVSPEVFPDGLGSFSEKIHSMGLMFGLWMEPEMVNPDSELYRKHPDWIIEIPGRKAALTRHQAVLDITREDVRDYLYSSLEAVISSANVDYIKWDMNRTITDLFSSNPSCHSNGELQHRYVLGLYELAGRFTERFPEILFEGCASGGNRYDLGMLSFMPQIWTSDNTDLYQRMTIEAGTLRGFPQSAMGAHVSASPGHQSLRTSLIENRFDVAAFGSLGYELDLTKLSELDQEAIRNEIAFYKKYRKIFQFGDFRPLSSSDPELVFWSVTDGKTTIVMEFIKRMLPNTGKCDRLIIPFLQSDKHYRITNRRIIIPKEFFGDLWPQWNKEENEVFECVVSGDILSKAGILLPPRFMGNGLQSSISPVSDNGTRMYIIEEAQD